MGVIWHKIWFDLWHNKTRTLLAILSIAAGVFAVGAIFGMSDMLLANMDNSHHAVLPTHINVALSEAVDRNIILNLREIPGVEDVEPYNSVSVQYKLHPQDEWRQGVIQMRDNYDAQKYELVQLRDGHWPKGKNEISIERMAAQFLKIGIGDSVIFKIDEKERVIPVTGLIRHPFVPPPQFQDLAFYFMDSAGMERLGIPVGKFSSFYVRVTPYSSDHSKEVATAIKEKLSKQDIRISGFVYEDPDKHWGRTFFDGITQVQELLAVICVIMSAILVYNTLSNLITQQTDQIGILKAIGGKTRTIFSIYLFSTLIYGALAFLIALPLGAITAFFLSKSLLNLFNIDFDQFQYSNRAVTFQALSALAAPLLAGLPPILKGAGLTVREAIASYGLGSDYRSSWLDRLVEKIGQRWLPSYYAQSLGNMFRHKGRLLMTQLVLVAAGSSFLMIMSLNSSIILTLDNFFRRQDYESTLYFDRNQRADRVRIFAQSVPGVEQVELRLIQGANMYVEGQLVKEAGIGANIKGIAEGSDFFKPLIVSGRWLAPGDGSAIVISRDTSQKNDIQVGDTVTLNLGEMGKDEWLVVGTYEPVFVGTFNMETMYAPAEALYKTSKKHDQGSELLIRTTSTEGEFTSKVTENLKDLFESHSMRVVDSQTQAALRTTNEWQFSIVTSMLLALSVIVALVGGIALMGALSIGVIERTKEIGVLRAIGARSPIILGIFVMEGIFQGCLSWLVSIPVSYLASPSVASALGHALFGATLDYQYNWSAVIIWLGIIVIVSAIASFFPARGATRISVRDSLAYA
ncbi:MAG: ABC transporter permease [Anaerolineales bacterium]|jgi:putative ABC transport system permease protein